MERAYHLGLVSVLCATSTLAAGVNLPARRVIFAQPFIGYYAPDGSTVLDGTRWGSGVACRTVFCSISVFCRVLAVELRCCCSVWKSLTCLGDARGTYYV